MKSLFTIQDYESHALKILSPSARDFYIHSAGDGITYDLNKEAFKRIRIRPRLLRDVSKRDCSTTILGRRISMPVGISPTAKQKLAHVDGECANARAAQAAETIFILSSYSNSTVEEVTKAAPHAIKWFQMAIHKDRDCSIHFIRRAEQAGFEALVVTVDYPILPQEKYRKQEHSTSSGYVLYEDYLSIKYPSGKSTYPDKWIRGFIDDSVSWEAITWIRRSHAQKEATFSMTSIEVIHSITKLPIVLKGILTAEDALLAVKYGANSIIVSNHGGRQLDGSPATIEALPEIVEAVGDKIEIYLDGGIRKGTDVFKALALGAKMVFMGRPMLWGLACGGEEGSRAILEIMRQEMNEVFALSGCVNVKDITKDMVRHETAYNCFK